MFISATLSTILTPFLRICFLLLTTKLIFNIIFSIWKIAQFYRFFCKYTFYNIKYVFQYTQITEFNLRKSVDFCNIL